MSEQAMSDEETQRQIEEWVASVMDKAMKFLNAERFKPVDLVMLIEFLKLVASINCPDQVASSERVQLVIARWMAQHMVVPIANSTVPEDAPMFRFKEVEMREVSGAEFVDLIIDDALLEGEPDSKDLN